MDMDNIAKCVLDAMNGVAYVDDRQVLHQYSRAYDLSEPFWLSGGPVDLIKPLARHAEYIFVRIRAVGGRRRARQPVAPGRRTSQSSGPGARVARIPAAHRGRSTTCDAPVGVEIDDCS
jgi:hypothetical protein